MSITLPDNRPSTIADGTPSLEHSVRQVKWNYGALDLMWPGQRGDAKGQPFHPNLRLR